MHKMDTFQLTILNVITNRRKCITSVCKYHREHIYTWRDIYPLVIMNYLIRPTSQNMAKAIGY